MTSTIANLFDEAESRYLSAEDLNLLSQYVDSLPARLSAYRLLRDRELEVVQHVADQLQAEMPQEAIENLERAIKNALLVLRYCAMGMLLNSDTFVKDRLASWVGSTLRFYNSQTINQSLYQLLTQHLAAVLSAQELNLLIPHLRQALELMQAQPPQSTSDI